MVSLFIDDAFLDHHAPEDHPERPERLAATLAALKAAHVLDRTRLTPVRPASDQELARVHTGGYLDDLVRAVPGKTGYLDPDTFFSPGTWVATRKAAGAAAEACLQSLSGEAARALVLVRPPGHHAEADRAMGFCLINNAAVAAAAARAAGAARVAIVNWDVHHGNGTQHIFEADPDVLYISTHQWPFYPGTGAAREIGRGAGKGATLNIPLPGGFGAGEYRAVFAELVLPALRAFRPDLILISAGYDAHEADPLGGMRMPTPAYGALTAELRQVAAELCGDRLVLLLEGGYDLRGLAESVVVSANVLLADTAPPPPPRPERHSAAHTIATVRAAIEGHLGF